MDELENSGETADLNAWRTAVSVPTLLTSLLARKCGGEIIQVKPGRVDFESFGTDQTLKISLVNIYAREAQLYRELGLPVPDNVLTDMRDWKPEF